MQFSIRIARRYLLAKKSTNAINIITGIAVFGIAVGSAALILVLSVFNGFEDLIATMYSNFNPDVKVIPAQGKTFNADAEILDKLRALDEIAAVTTSLEEVAFFEYKDNQDFGTLKGVAPGYEQVVGIDTTVWEGKYQLKDGEKDLAILGLGMRDKLNVSIGDPFTELGVYMPRRSQSKGLFGRQLQPFRRRYIYPGGTFVIQHEFNNEYIIAPISFARSLLDADPDEVSAIEIRLSKGVDSRDAVTLIEATLGEGYEVRDRFEQEAAFLKLMQIEKWLSYAIASLMLLLVSFNMIGALWMIVLEKQPDIAILRSMGALKTTIRDIFLAEGVLLSLLGLVIGILLALGLYAAQKYIGLITVPGNFIVEAYPISLRFIDFLTVSITVIVIGLLAALPPALRAMRVSVLIRQE
ncbi:MAG: ABC transporter permease [Phaeodactylibacter sp.]|nr:ABC transporter permease [Phaeodactylibacter sp.]